MTKYIKEIISALTFLSGIAIGIYGFGVRNANKANESIELKKSVVELNTSVIDLKKSVHKVDSTIIDFGHIQEVQGITIDNYVLAQKRLIQNYAKFVQDYSKDWKSYFQGLTFEVVQDEPMKSVFPNPVIRARRISKDSVK